MSIKLREFIRNFRSCKTAGEERAVVAKECALIRTAFKEDNAHYRERNVAKVLFIQLMGYPCQFAQMECLKLIASSDFGDKRMGYLGLAQIMDESTEVLMLATNSIKNDLKHPSQYVNALALASLGNNGTPEMCRSLAREVEDLCSFGSPYIRKKAILCAMRLISKVEDIAERFLPTLPTLFDEKNHGILIASCSLLSTLIQTQPEHIVERFRKTILPLILNCFRRVLVLSTYSKNEEYDVAGIADPFLQFKLLRCIKLLLANGKTELMSEVMDVLSQVAAMTDAAKTANNAILLEYYITVLAIQPPSTSRPTDLNILDRFLKNKSSNLKFVGLSALQQSIEMDISFVESHSSAIIQCLEDEDPSIQQSALNLMCQLLSEQNIDLYVDKLIDHLRKSSSQANPETFTVLVTKLCGKIEEHCPTRRWLIDKYADLFAVAGPCLSMTFWNTLIHVIIFTPDLQLYATRKFLQLALDQPSQPYQVFSALWCLGEFGSTLLTSDPSQEKYYLEAIEKLFQTVIDSRQSAIKQKPAMIGESALFDVPHHTPDHEYLSTLLVTCAAKLAARLTSSHPQLTRLFNDKIVQEPDTLESSQRALEFQLILASPDFHNQQKEIFDAMVVNVDAMGNLIPNLRSILSKPIGETQDKSSFVASKTTHTAEQEGDLLKFDLLSSPVDTSKPQEQGNANVDVEALLADIFSAAPAPITTSTKKPDQNTESPLMDLI